MGKEEPELKDLFDFNFLFIDSFFPDCLLLQFQASPLVPLFFSVLLITKYCFL